MDNEITSTELKYGHFCCEYNGIDTIIYCDDFPISGCAMADECNIAFDCTYNFIVNKKFYKKPTDDFNPKKIDWVKEVLNNTIDIPIDSFNEKEIEFAKECVKDIKEIQKFLIEFNQCNISYEYFDWLKIALDFFLSDIRKRVTTVSFRYKQDYLSEFDFDNSKKKD